MLQKKDNQLEDSLDILSKLWDLPKQTMEQGNQYSSKQQITVTCHHAKPPHQREQKEKGDKQSLIRMLALRNSCTFEISFVLLADALGSLWRIKCLNFLGSIGKLITAQSSYQNFCFPLEIFTPANIKLIYSSTHYNRVTLKHAAYIIFIFSSQSMRVSRFFFLFKLGPYPCVATGDKKIISQQYVEDRKI